MLKYAFNKQGVKVKAVQLLLMLKVAVFLHVLISELGLISSNRVYLVSPEVHFCYYVFKDRCKFGNVGFTATGVMCFSAESGQSENCISGLSANDLRGNLTVGEHLLSFSVQLYSFFRSLKRIPVAFELEHSMLLLSRMNLN